MHVNSARPVQVDYAPNHQMQCAIELRTLNSTSAPNLVSLAQNFLEPEDPSRRKLFGPGARSLHPTRTATKNNNNNTDCGSILVTCKFGAGGTLRLACRGSKRTKGTKYYTTRALHVHTALKPIKSYSAKYIMSRSTHLYRVWCL